MKRWAKKEKKKDSLWFKCKKHFSSELHRLMSLYFFIVYKLNKIKIVCIMIRFMHEQLFVARHEITVVETLMMFCYFFNQIIM